MKKYVEDQKSSILVNIAPNNLNQLDVHFLAGLVKACILLHSFIPSSSSVFTCVFQMLKTCFQHLKTRFHCHSVFVVHTSTPGLYDAQFGYFQMICQLK
jgi:hypothetical protein